MSHTPPSSSETDAASRACPFAGGARTRTRIAFAGWNWPCRRRAKASGVAARAGQAVPLGHPRIAPRPAGRRTSFPGTEYRRASTRTMSPVSATCGPDLLRNDYRGETPNTASVHPRRRWRLLLDTRAPRRRGGRRRRRAPRRRHACRHQRAEGSQIDRAASSSTATGNSEAAPGGADHGTRAAMSWKWNRQAEKVFGWSSAQVHGKRMAEQLVSKATANAMPRWRGRRSRGIRSSGGRDRLPHPRRRDIAAAGGTWRCARKARSVGLMTLALDITEQYHTEQQLELYRNDLRTAGRAADRRTRYRAGSAGADHRQEPDPDLRARRQPLRDALEPGLRRRFSASRRAG